LDAAK